MGNPYIGEIRLFAGNFAPQGWMFCDGALVGIAENQPLYSLLGTTYGGDGQSTFGLPDLRGRLPSHVGPLSVLGQRAGVEAVTLKTTEIPTHTHFLQGSGNPAQNLSPAMSIPAAATSTNVQGLQPYAAPPANTPLSPSSVANTGGTMPHSNFQPYLCVNFIISLYGIFPPRG